jgi:hypothetical protein
MLTICAVQKWQSTSLHLQWPTGSFQSLAALANPHNFCPSTNPTLNSLRLITLSPPLGLLQRSLHGVIQAVVVDPKLAPRIQKL